jgi:hypothetical protein
MKLRSLLILHQQHRHKTHWSKQNNNLSMSSFLSGLFRYWDNRVCCTAWITTDLKGKLAYHSKVLLDLRDSLAINVILVIYTTLLNHAVVC